MMLPSFPPEAYRQSRTVSTAAPMNVAGNTSFSVFTEDGICVTCGLSLSGLRITVSENGAVPPFTVTSTLPSALSVMP
ncbi:hypothetical protein HRbin16_02709 [bacterium HR16]|nr:hypothetical protein HRbin16_02709 [bacterium HR16]